MAADMTPEQAEKVADGLLEQPRKEIQAKRQARGDAAARERRRGEVLVPALTASIAVLIAMEYTLNPVLCVLLGTLVGGLFGWAVRRQRLRIPFGDGA